MPTANRPLLDRWLRRAEDLVYTVIAVLLVLAAALILVMAVWEFFTRFGAADMSLQALRMLDQLLLVLMLIELLHTVRVSLRARGLLPEPFLMVGLIAALRRVVVITAEAWHMGEVEPVQFQRAMIELALLTVLTLILVISIILLRRFRAEQPEPSNAPQHA